MSTRTDTSTVHDPIVDRWAAAWTGNRPGDLAALFSSDGQYDDLAFGATWRGGNRG